MKDRQGRIIYIGKAASICKRVRSYFQKQACSPRIEALLAKLESIDYINTSSQAEALILEAGLIKEHKPKYNIAIKDDKAYPWLKLTINEKYPRLLIVRQRKDDGAVYFGPYTEAGLLRQARALLSKNFPLRTCRCFPKSVCLNYHLGQCAAPCVKKINPAGYKKIVKELILFLRGKKAKLVKQLNQKMQQAANKKDYESAAILRDRITSLTSVVSKIRSYNPRGQLEELEKFLNLPKRPQRIEAVDISNISGKEAAGAMVCFIDGKPAKSEYRWFKIKTVSGIDDYKMLREVISRRFKEDKTFPDLIVIDGGKGQLNVVSNRLRELNLKSIPLISIAKQFEYIYQPGKVNPVMLPLDSLSLRLVRRVRDEAHRFALKYHHNLRRRLIIKSELDNIANVGRIRKKALLMRFDSITQIKTATKKQLLTIEGIDEKTAENIREYFKKHNRD
ncbi:MAG: excinuclease ABC subunit UvrC [Candidatus Omnitrophota bacterium]